ncbi:MAG: CDP-alcohol phosphatidyltransferase family protein [Enterocloster clostridioformis]
MNLPNKLTIIRVCLIPFFAATLLFDHGNNYTMRIVGKCAVHCGQSHGSV